MGSADDDTCGSQEHGNHILNNGMAGVCLAWQGTLPPSIIIIILQMCSLQARHLVINKVDHSTPKDEAREDGKESSNT